jgi:hypothetical protein
MLKISNWFSSLEFPEDAGAGKQRRKSNAHERPIKKDELNLIRFLDYSLIFTPADRGSLTPLKRQGNLLFRNPLK